MEFSIEEENARSIRVQEKLKTNYEGIRKNFFNEKDVAVYAFNSTDYLREEELRIIAT